MGELINKPSNILSNTINVHHTSPPLLSPLYCGSEIPIPLPHSPPSLFLFWTILSSSSLLLLTYVIILFSSSSLLLCSLFPPPLLLSLLNPLLPPGPAGLCGANHQTAAPLSPLTEQLPPPQQCSTLLSQSPATVATIQDPHLANRGGGLGQGGPSGLMEGTRRVNY